MNKILYSLIATFVAIPFVAGGQSVIDTHPAGNPRARLLTIEEIAGAKSSSVYPSRVRLYWDANGELSKSVRRTSPEDYTLPVSDKEGVVYGQSVSRNEFGGNRWVIPSPDGSRLAVYRKDESGVSLYPIYDIRSRTGEAKMIRSPMAGMASEKLGICICDKSGNILSELQVTDYDNERYLTNPTWSPDGKYIFIQVLDRVQHRMRLNMYRSSDGSFVRTVLSERNNDWIEPLDPLYFIKDSYEFIYRTDNRDGYRSLYLCDTLGKVKRLTKCNADVAYVANDGKYVYYTSAEVSPVENHLFRLKLKDSFGLNRPQRLTPETGWHQISMSPDCSRFIDRYSSLNVPGVTQVRDSNGNLLQRVSTSPDPLDIYAQCQVELGTVKSADAQTDNYYRLFYPRDYDPSKKYPLIVYVYGGPHSQMVTNRKVISCMFRTTAAHRTVERHSKKPSTARAARLKVRIRWRASTVFWKDSQALTAAGLGYTAGAMEVS